MTESTEAHVTEATLTDNGAGLEPTTDGWYVVNIADAAGWSKQGGGYGVAFESAACPFTQFGVNVHVVRPGEPSARYHFEPAQEAFLVLSGECMLVVEEQERTFRAGDFFHCPPNTRHVTIGAGNAPCAILMIGSRTVDGVGYPVSEIAARHGASVEEFTDDPEVAYAGDPDIVSERVDLSWVLQH